MSTEHLLTDAALPVAGALALGGGLLAFASPCVLPLIPGYLGYVSGSTVPTEGAATRRRTVAGAGLFVSGFSVVFIGLFVLSGTAGLFLLQYAGALERGGGVIMIVLGLVFVGQVTVLQRQLKLTWRPRAGLVGAPLLGAIFALGWTPCIGPTILAIISLASYTGDPGRAAVLGIAYCVGLGAPFVLVALGFQWATASMRWLRRHTRTINILGGSAIIVMGVLMAAGVWGSFLSATMGSVISEFLPAL